jgi:hypothetical protein
MAMNSKASASTPWTLSFPSDLEEFDHGKIFCLRSEIAKGGGIPSLYLRKDAEKFLAIRYPVVLMVLFRLLGFILQISFAT